MKEGVPAEELDAKLAALSEKETRGLSAEERRHNFRQKRASKKAAAAPAEGT